MKKEWGGFLEVQNWTDNKGARTVWEKKNEDNQRRAQRDGL